MLPRIFKETIDLIVHNPNQFLGGGLMLGMIGGVVAYFKDIPRKIYEWVLHLFSMTLTMTDDSEALVWFKWWFDQHERSKKIRHVDVFTPYLYDTYKTILSPAPGAHWFIYMGRPFRLEFTREKEKPKYAEARPETITLRVIGRDQPFLKKFVENIQQKYDETHKSRNYFHYWANSGWNSSGDFSPRSWESVILPSQMKKDIVEDIQDFKNNREWYDSVGMPYHRSYLLYGPPGTGKTSSLLGLSSHFKMDLYLLKISSMTDDLLVAALREIHSNSMVVLEDVDCLNNKREGVLKEKKKGDNKKEGNASLFGLTLSGLLNALDGIETPTGSMFFLTTNLIDKLDPALLRPGRVDKKYFLGPATDEQKLEMFHRFFPRESEKYENDPEIFVMNHPELKTMAEFQEALKQKRSEA